ncbi:MAG: MFS transporter, partial [Sciscionella sp.]
ALLGVFALAAWAVAARHGTRKRASTAIPPPANRTLRSLLHSRLAWLVTIYFGLQSLFAYVMMGWMPQVFVDAGVSRGTAGVLLAITSVLGVPCSLVVTPIAARQRSQSGWAAGLTLIGGLGVIGLLVAPAAAPWLWSVLIGVGMGAFTVAIALISLRTRDPADTRQLSTMTQGIGYLLAAVGPLVFGLLRGITGSWTMSLTLLLAAVCLQVVIGILAGRPRYI